MNVHTILSLASDINIYHTTWKLAFSEDWPVLSIFHEFEDRCLYFEFEELDDSTFY